MREISTSETCPKVAGVGAQYNGVVWCQQKRRARCWSRNVQYRKVVGLHLPVPTFGGNLRCKDADTAICGDLHIVRKG